MQTSTLEMDAAEAARMWRKYKEHRAWSTPMDHEIERVYREIAKGGVIIQAIASIVAAGVGDDGLPKLALVRADAEDCFCRINFDGSARMADDSWLPGNAAKSRYIEFPENTWPRRSQNGQAIVPHIPPDIRPRRGLANYHILFEAVWSPIPPRDPFLLKRLGGGDVWLVVGAWDLTEVERAAMASRIKPR
jgi:hypothetical protein